MRLFHLCILLIPPFGCILSILLEALGLLKPFYSKEVAPLVGPTFAYISPFALTCSPTMQIPFALLACFGLVPADFTTVPALFLGYTITFNRRMIYLFLMPSSYTPGLGQCLDLRHIVAQHIKIGAV